MTETRVENSEAGKLFYRENIPATGISGLFSKDDMTGDVTRYWTIIELERRFMIPFWRAERLIAKSNLNQMALKVINIEHPEEIDAEWVSFDSDLIAAIEEDTVAYSVNNSIRSISVIVSNLIPTEDAAYFAFGDDIMDIFRQAYISVGSVADDERQDRSISARIGRTDDGETVVFFILSETKMHDGGGNTGGPSISCGTKFPPGQ